METDPDAQRVDEQVRSSEHNGPADKGSEHAHVDGIARIAVQPTDHKLFRRVDGRRRAMSENGKIPHAPSIDDAAYRKKSERKKKHQARCGGTTPCKKQRNIDAYRPRHDQCK